IDVRIINDIQDEDLHILCVKSGDLPNVLSVIKKKALRSPILFLQNGMGHINLIRNLENPVFVGVIEHGAVRENDWTFNHLGRGQIRLASLQDDKDMVELAHELHSDEYKVESNEDWELMLKEKLII